MTIDYERISLAFKHDAWAYAECLDSVRIGKWHGAESKFSFFDGMSKKFEDLLLLLRVFDKNRELRFIGERYRDTDMYTSDTDNIYVKEAELIDSRYFMYGEQYEPVGDYTRLWEKRGGNLYFPGILKFPDGNVTLKLNIRNFIRYNPVPVCPKKDKHDYGLSMSGAGALDVFDYAYTGFHYADGEAVEL